MNFNIVGIVTDTGMTMAGVVLGRRISKSVTTLLVGARKADQRLSAAVQDLVVYC